MRKQFLFGMILASVLGTASGATFINENFEAFSGTAGIQTSAGLIPGTQFTLVSGTIDVNNATSYPVLCRAPAAITCIDTTGGGATPRGIFESASSFNFLANVQYALSFALVRWDDTGINGSAGPQTTALRVTVGGNNGLFDQTFITDATYTNGIITRYFTPSVNTLAKLRFTDLGVSNVSTSYAGAIVDGVSLGDAASVPEPATFAFVGLGIAALAGVRRLTYNSFTEKKAPPSAGLFY